MPREVIASGILIDGSHVMKTMRYLILLIIVASCALSNKSLTEEKARERMKSFDQESQDNINRLINMIE